MIVSINQSINPGSQSVSMLACLSVYPSLNQSLHLFYCLFSGIAKGGLGLNPPWLFSV